MAWRGWELGLSGDQVRLIQERLIKKYQWVRDSYPHLSATGYFDKDTQDAVSEFQRRTSLPVTGIADWKTQQRLGMFDVPAKKAMVLTIPGTWAGWNDGPPAWTAWGLDKNRYYQQGVGYPAMGFLTPDPNISYDESRDAGIEETIRLINLTPAGTPLIIIGYSQGADVAIKTAAEFLGNGRLASRRNDVKRIITFGSPCRPEGPTLIGNNPPGSGISGFYTPDEFRSITWDYVTNGDMYACSTKLLRLFYQILTKMELSVEFATAVIQILGSAVAGNAVPVLTGGQGGIVGGILGGLFGGAGNNTQRSIIAVSPTATQPQVEQLTGLLSDLGDVAQTIQVALQFAATGAHMNYHTWPDFQGRSAVQHAIDGLNGLRW